MTACSLRPATGKVGTVEGEGKVDRERERQSVVGTYMYMYMAITCTTMEVINCSVLFQCYEYSQWAGALCFGTISTLVAHGIAGVNSLPLTCTRVYSICIQL